MRKQWDPRTRRETLFQIHSSLRSADNLRPDEAFDELVKLYELWSERRVIDSDAALVAADINLSAAALGVALPRLQALLSADDVVAADLFQELADVAVRSGLGQYFTPGPAARAIAAFLDPKPGECWMDPFCGSGLLLGEVALVTPDVSLHGTDLDPRVLRLAALEGRLRHPGTSLSLARTSALADRQDVLAAVEAPAEGVDGIVTNPPFGALDLQGEGIAGLFALASAGVNAVEVLGLEQSLRLLRPGGRIGIVLPQSVLSNKRSDIVRAHVAEVARIDGVLSLPPETFGLFKGVGKASVLFATKRSDTVDKSHQIVWFGLSRSIGWDATGRPGEPEDVTSTALAMRDRIAMSGAVEPRTRPDTVRNLTVEWNLRSRVGGSALGDLTGAIFTGRTPPRREYCEWDPADPDVLRVLKVANLTGAGINWAAGDRSFARFKRLPEKKLLHVGDVVLTAAAHHPRYIGAKVDLVDELPDDGSPCVACGEVMVIRCTPDLSPRTLVLWLRTLEGRAAIQACSTGQTAHLHPDYVADVVVPTAVLAADMGLANELLTEGLRRRRAFEAVTAEASEVFAATLRGDTASAAAAA